MDIDIEAFGAALTARLETSMTVEAATAAVRAAEAAHDAAVRIPHRSDGLIGYSEAYLEARHEKMRETFEALGEARRVLIVVTRRCADTDQHAIFTLRRQAEATQDPEERFHAWEAHDEACRAYDRKYLRQPA